MQGIQIDAQREIESDDMTAWNKNNAVNGSALPWTININLVSI